MRKLIYHHNSQNPNDRFTFVGEVDDDSIKISAAKCKDKDNFCKRLGRTIAEGRLSKNLVDFQDTIDGNIRLSRKDFNQVCSYLASRHSDLLTDTRKIWKTVKLAQIF